MRNLAVVLAAFVPLVYADQVVLKNGDTITGNIIKKDGARLTIKSEFLGEVSMPWTAVQSVKSDAALTVVLPGGETVAGTVATANGRIEIAGKSAALTEVGDIRNPDEQRSWERIQHPGILQLWTGSFDLGYALARGNARTNTLTNGLNATRVTRRDKTKLYFTQIRASARVNGVVSRLANATRGGWQYNRDITPKLFGQLFNDYEFDRFQNLDLRFVFGGGLGLNAVKTEKANLTIMGGGAYNREKFRGDIKRNSAEAYFGDDFLYKFSAATSFTQSFRLFPNLSNTGEYRMNFDLGAVTVLRRWLSWNVTASDRFLSNPVFGRQRNDILLTTGFRVSFAR